MPPSPVLSEPAHRIPLDDDQLIIMGRIAVMWGVVDEFLNLSLARVYGVDQSRLVDRIRRLEPATSAYIGKWGIGKPDSNV